MPLNGNRLGPRGKFAYTSDDGTVYKILTDADLGEASGLPESTGTERAKPSRFTPRGVWAQADVAATADDEGGLIRKFIVCNPDSTLYRSATPQTVVIDGLTLTTTGRVGEKATY